MDSVFARLHFVHSLHDDILNRKSGVLIFLMLQSEDKNGLFELLKKNCNEPIAPVEREEFHEPKTEFSLAELPESPHKRMLESSASSSNAYINDRLNNTESSLSRFRKVSASFITGATIVTNLPSRHDLVLYNKQIIKGLRGMYKW